MSDKNKDVSLDQPNNFNAKMTEYNIAFLNRRIENLEEIVFELLREKVHYELGTGYQDTNNFPDLSPSTTNVKD